MGGKTQTSSSEPWSAAQPALKTTLSDAGKLYSSGVGGGVYTGATKAGLTSQQNTGLQMQSDVARGFDNWMNMGKYNLDGISGASQEGQSYSEKNLGDIASGKYLSGGDPYFEDALSTSSRKAQDAVNLQASGMGRSGSGANYGNVARELGEIQTSARSNQYNQERANQMSANQMLDTQRNTGLDRQLGVFDRMGTAFEYAKAPGQLMQDVGAQYQQQAQNVIDDQVRMFDASQNAPWEQLGRYNAIAQGMGGLGGTQTQTQSGGALGGLGSIAQLLGML
jgi:hypothetical protein